MSSSSVPKSPQADALLQEVRRLAATVASPEEALAFWTRIWQGAKALAPGVVQGLPLEHLPLLVETAIEHGAVMRPLAERSDLSGAFVRRMYALLRTRARRVDRDLPEDGGLGASLGAWAASGRLTAEHRAELLDIWTRARQLGRGVLAYALLQDPALEASTLSRFLDVLDLGAAERLDIILGHPNAGPVHWALVEERANVVSYRRWSADAHVYERRLAMVDLCWRPLAASPGLVASAEWTGRTLDGLSRLNVDLALDLVTRSGAQGTALQPERVQAVLTQALDRLKPPVSDDADGLEAKIRQAVVVLPRGLLAAQGREPWARHLTAGDRRVRRLALELIGALTVLPDPTRAAAAAAEAEGTPAPTTGGRPPAVPALARATTP